MPLAGDDQPGLDAALFLGPPDAFADTGYIGIGAEPDALAVVGRNDELAVDRIDAGEFVEIGFGQKRIVLLGLVDLGNLVVTFEEACEIMPDIGAVAKLGADVDAIFLCLRCGQSWRCRTLQMAVQFDLLQMRCHRKLLPCGPAGMPRCRAMLSPISA